MMTRKGFFAMMAAVIAGTKAAPAAWQEKVCTAVVGRTAIVADAEAIAAGQAWLQEVQIMNDDNFEWSYVNHRPHR